MEYFKSTSKIRAEVKDNYFFVRDLTDKGGVIDGILNQNQCDEVVRVIQGITDENFSLVWDKLRLIKGVKIDFQRN